MKRTFSILVSLAVCMACTSLSKAAIPAGYYSSLANKQTAALKTAARDVIYDHTMLRYNDLFPVHFKVTDVRKGTSPLQWWDMYSSKTFYVNNGWSGMNREHSFPKSWWGGDTNLPAYTDLNHLYPSESSANTAKNNYPLGEVAVADFDNGVSKVGSPMSGQGGGCSKVYEPADEYKGDFARTYFYMVTCYQDVTWKYTYMAQSGTYPSLSTWAINLLLKWHRQDPVSQKEINRNEAVYAEQGNRNPFIDLPELAEYIWGNKKGQSFSLDDIGGTPEVVNPAPGSTVDLGKIAVGVEGEYVVNVKGKNLYGNVSLALYDTDGHYVDYTLGVRSISAVSVNGTTGYNVPIKFSSSTIGDHSTKISIYDGGLDGNGVNATLKLEVVETPVLTPVTMLAPTDVTTTAYTANWTAADEEIDYYYVTRTIYSGSSVKTLNYTTTATSYRFTDVTEGSTEDITVQTVRYGVYSDESNTVHVDPAGVGGVSIDRGLTVYSDFGEAVFVCGAPHADVVIYNMSGQAVRRLQEATNGTRVQLPAGVYIVRTAQLRRPIKITVR